MRNWVLLSSTFVLAVLGTSASAVTVWTGSPTTFTKDPGADWTLPANQDRITSTVWITRAGTQGIFNIQQEAGYTHDSSPLGTAWAYGSAANWASLTFTDWEEWANHDPPGTVGRDAVLHLIDGDIYLDIKFLSFGESYSGGGAFSYQRSTAPEPATFGLLALGGLLLPRRRR